MFRLDTERLFLRHFHILDHEPMMQVFGDPEVMRFGDGVQTPEWVRGWLITCLEHYYKTWGFGPYAVVEKRSQRVIGYCGLFYFPEIDGQPEVEIGYRLAKSAWGHGYASEAALAVREYAFGTLAMKRLVALIDPSNTASIRVAEKLGMKYEKEVTLEGYTHPDHLYTVSALDASIKEDFSRQGSERSAGKMQIDYASSGGFANVQLNYRADTDTMPEAQAQELIRLVESSGVLGMQQNDTPPQTAAGAADVFFYRLTLSEGGRQKTLWFDDTSAPESVRQLLSYLRKLAMEQKRKPE